LSGDELRGKSRHVSEAGSGLAATACVIVLRSLPAQIYVHAFHLACIASNAQTSLLPDEGPGRAVRSIAGLKTRGATRHASEGQAAPGGVTDFPAEHAPGGRTFDPNNGDSFGEDADGFGERMPRFRPVRGIEDANASDTVQPESASARALGGTHHCIATAYATVNALFRHLRSECDLNGGSLTGSDLDSVRAEFIDKFKFALGLFDGIHARCMQASHASAPMLFMKGQILPSLLLACTHRAAERALHDQIGRFGPHWLNIFYGALSFSIGERCEFNIEVRLTGAYIKTICELGRDLSVERLLRKRSARDILREGLATFRSTDWSEQAVACLNDEINRFVGANLAGAAQCAIADSQMRDFIRLFLQDLDRSLTSRADRRGLAARGKREMAFG
jgi:hypothetical protein